MPRHEKLDYVEFASLDLTASKAFFTTVFGWTFTDYGPDYSAFADQGLDGGLCRTDAQPVGGPLLVFYSDDIQATLAKVQQHGGLITRPLFDFPGGCRFHFQEPGGNELAVWAKARR